MIDQAGIMMAQGLGTASERIQGVNDNKIGRASCRERV